MGRYTGTLHKLIDSASSSDSKTKWNQVLNYVEGHTVASTSKNGNPAFDSPLPPYSSPSVELEAELLDPQGSQREDTPLKIAIKSAPSVVIAALCHMGPEAVNLADSRERLPLHWACRRSSEDHETEKILTILIRCSPHTLLHRDDGGRTPLHWLFWYHAPSRSPDMVKFCCQLLPTKIFSATPQPRNSANERYPLPEIPLPSSRTGIPANAAVMPDMRHGALPLHYAVMQGASKEAIKALVTEYPNALAYGDRKGRTPLAWYLGAGHLMDNNKRHVCGEANDPTATPWWYVKLSPVVVQMLATSKVARILDDMGRTPLHWAAHFYAKSYSVLETPTFSNKMVQTLLDHNIGALTTQDGEGKTPLHVLFDVIAYLQETEHKRALANNKVRDDINLFRGGPSPFVPSKGLIELLLKNPEASAGQERFQFDRDQATPSAAHVEDTGGFLPLHMALRVATGPEIIQLLIQSNPTSLVHTSEELVQTPLIQAFYYQHTAPLQIQATFQLLMEAYVTSRHGTFMDGRLALKMEDASGVYPLHYAARNGASVETIRLFVEKFPRCALFKDVNGDLPLHLILSQENLFLAPDSGLIHGASLAKRNGLLTEKEQVHEKNVKNAFRQRMKVLMSPMVSPEFLRIGSSKHAMTPLHIAVAFEVLDYDSLFRMMDTHPEAAAARTLGHAFSCLDLHEMTKTDTENDEEDWQAVRELVYAFYPAVEEYRHQEELLDACVKLIRDELLGAGSYHIRQDHEKKKDEIGELAICETLSSIAVPEIETAGRPKSRRKAITPKRKKNRNRLLPNSPARALNLVSNAFSFGSKKQEKSIYDDDALGGGYTLSPQQTGNDDEDEDDFLSSEEEEEYFSDESSSGSESPTDRGTNSYDESTKLSSWDVNEAPSRTSFTTEHHSLGKGVKRDSSSFVEEKKEELPSESGASPREERHRLSDVAMRLWSFFVCYNDKKNPDDNYFTQVDAVLMDVDFEHADYMINLSLPTFAHGYLEPGATTAGVTLRDVACPTVKALFESTYYFLGRYEFPLESDGVLLHRSTDGNTVLIKAYEHKPKTRVHHPGTRLPPGEAEETIWSTGVRADEDDPYMASKFKDSKRPVFFRFTRSVDAYQNDVLCRQQMGLVSGGNAIAHNIVPLVEQYISEGTERKDRRYEMDIHDDRFQSLKLFGGETIQLSDYPYALVYPHCEEGDLFDYFVHHGVEGIDEISDIGAQVGNALMLIHQNGIVHGRISMRRVSMVPLDNDDPSPHRTWVVSDLTSACVSEDGQGFVGKITQDGSALFETGLLPPEMFVKISSAEARIYQTYWEIVEKLYNVTVDNSVVEPFVNLETGSTYVLRCHYLPDPNGLVQGHLPKLPYQLVPARESTDLWCFGLMLFALCSGGRPLFPANLKTGHLLNYESIVAWDKKTAKATIYEHVQDPLAQDVLLKILSPYEERADLTMEYVLQHPFFRRARGVPAATKLVDLRLNESAAYDRKRRQILTEKSEGDWLMARTTTINCWDFDMLRKIHFSTSEIICNIIGGDSRNIAMPCSFLVLPYRLSSKNRKAKLAPTTKKDVERAERMGALLLHLGKACNFACQVKDIVEREAKGYWTVMSLMEELNLPEEGFESIKEDFAKVATANVEAFRSNPAEVVLKIVEKRVNDVKKLFKDATKAYLYLVDEHARIPLVGAAFAPYPLEVPEKIIDQVLVKTLPFMHSCALSVRGISGGVSGLVRLIFEAAFPHIPPSWAKASTGLSHTLDEAAIHGEIRILHETLSSMSSSKRTYIVDDLQFLRSVCQKLDPNGRFGDMHRVTCAGHSFWTTREGAADVQETCRIFDFKDALDVHSSLESQLYAQDEEIKALREEMSRLRFRKDLNLDVPEESEGITPTSRPGYNEHRSSKAGRSPLRTAQPKPPVLTQNSWKEQVGITELRSTKSGQSQSPMRLSQSESRSLTQSLRSPSSELSQATTQSNSSFESTQKTVSHSNIPVVPIPPAKSPLARRRSKSPARPTSKSPLVRRKSKSPSRPSTSKSPTVTPKSKSPSRTSSKSPMAARVLAARKKSKSPSRQSSKSPQTARKSKSPSRPQRESKSSMESPTDAGQVLHSLENTPEPVGRVSTPGSRSGLSIDTNAQRTNYSSVVSDTHRSPGMGSPKQMIGAMVETPKSYPDDEATLPIHNRTCGTPEMETPKKQLGSRTPRNPTPRSRTPTKTPRSNKSFTPRSNLTPKQGNMKGGPSPAVSTGSDVFFDTKTCGSSFDYQGKHVTESTDPALPDADERSVDDILDSNSLD